MKELKCGYIADNANVSETEQLIRHIIDAQMLDTLNWTEFEYCPKVELRVAYSDSRLWLHYRVEEQNIRAQNTNDGEKVYQDSCVEFFVQQADAVHYINFEFNCIGTLLAACRTGRNDAMPLSCEQMNSVIRLSSLPFEKIDKFGNALHWSLTVGIPFSLLGFDRAPDELRANFYKCGDLTATPHYLSWNPIKTPKPDFHRPEFFGRLILER